MGDVVGARPAQATVGTGQGALDGYCATAGSSTPIPKVVWNPGVSNPENGDLVGGSQK